MKYIEWCYFYSLDIHFVTCFVLLVWCIGDTLISLKNIPIPD